MNRDIFDGLDDDMPDADRQTGIPGASQQDLHALGMLGRDNPRAQRGVYVEDCPRCGGRGVVQPWGVCFRCNGAGKITFKTSRQQRAEARVKAGERRERMADDAWADFQEAHADQAAWIDANAATFEFAASMRAAVVKYGGLTENQAAAVNRCIIKAAERAAARELTAQAAPVVSIQPMLDAFERAGTNGLKRPIVRIGPVKVSRAPDTGRNAGGLYVKDKAGTYLGKLIGGRFYASRDASQDQQDFIVKACADPVGALVQHGRETGECGICGRELTDPESVARGIGPICAGNFGF